MRPVTCRWILLLPFCALLAPGCLHWVPAGKPIPETISEMTYEGGRTRVTLVTGERITYKAARVFADSVREGVGTLKGALLLPGYTAFQRGGRPVAVADVRAIEFWKINGPLSVLGLVGGGIAMYLFLSTVLVPI